MKFIFLCKRRPMARDLVERPYGRFFHLPRLLAAHGHEVHLALLSYARDESIDLQRDGMHWLAENVFAKGGMRYLSRVQTLVERTRPDWIVGLSDTYYGILAERLARRNAAKSLIDAYDNYEAYLPWCKPLHGLWRRALRRATAISAAGPGLAGFMAQGREPRTIHVAPMAPDPLGFRPMSMQECRRELGLPAAPTLVGYCGAIYPNRGIGVLFEAVELLKRVVPDVRLVLSGRKHRSVSLPPDATWLGYVRDEQMPRLLNSMNALTVINAASAFGNHSYPIKLYEAMSCQVPVVASSTLATQWILRGQPYLLAKPADAADLADKLAVATRRDRIDYGPMPTWEQVTLDLASFLGELA